MRWPRVGGNEGMISDSVLAWPEDTRPWAVSASSTGWNTRSSAQFQTSPADCATRQGRGKYSVTQRVVASLQDKIEVSPVGDLTLKGFHKPVPAFQLVSLHKSPEEQTDAAKGGEAV